jgi:hypothetical protein
MSIVVATVIAGDVQRNVCCTVKPAPQQINLLFALGEHVGYILSQDELCHRLKIGNRTLRYHACRLRQKLDHDWTVGAVSNRGYRLLYLGSVLSDVQGVKVDIPPELFVNTWSHSEETKALMRRHIRRRFPLAATRIRLEG